MGNNFKKKLFIKSYNQTLLYFRKICVNYKNMNVDESQKCMELAKKAMTDGNWEKAERMLNKSIRLHETTEAKNLLSNLDEIKKRF